MTVQTPPMGWNTWNTFGSDINEKLVMESADMLVSTGLAEAGYNYVVIDDCWSEMQRDGKGRLVADKNKFPHGMRAVADYIHSKGLKFGIYSCAGAVTCAQYPGSYDHEYIDAATFAEWGVDFLKYDYCYHTPVLDGSILYRRMGTALAGCGRDILFSACSWGVDETQQWIKTTGAHMWRSTGDIHDSWEFVKKLTLEQEKLLPYNGVGCFNDMDMLIVGMNGKGNVGVKGCTFEEYRTHFSVWALLGSPLMIGCDIRSMDENAAKILLNSEVIAINQDKKCNQPYRITSLQYEDGLIYARLLENGDIALGLFNMGDEKTRFSLMLDEAGIPFGCGKRPVLRNVWTGEEKEMANNILIEYIEPHDCLLYRVRLV